MARTNIYTGLQQSAAIRRNKYRRAARTTRALIRQIARDGLTPSRARNIADNYLHIEAAFWMGDSIVVTFVREQLARDLAFQIERIRYFNTEWKLWRSRNRQWRKEMEALDTWYSSWV